MTASYGAAISSRQYLRVTAAAGIGSVLEWYDYTVLIALSPIIQQVFFPPGDLAAKQLSFWSVYAVGYIFRPLGSLLFGHICDVYGRRLSLMITLVMMAIPTVLIGCLPSYAHAGLAAPITLSLLRLVQGIAVGGELGTAVVFLHELAPAGGKTKGGSIVFVGVTAGILMGIIVAMIINAAIPPGALLLWGWRLPFLTALLTATAGMMLRINMPESFEFEQDPVKAAYHHGRLHHHQQQQQQQQAGVPVSFSAASPNTDVHHRSRQEPLAANTPHSSAACASTEVSLLTDDLACQLDHPTQAARSPSGHAPKQQQVQQHAQQELKMASAAPPPRQQACCGSCAALFGHRPIHILFRQHWRELLLLFWFETWSAANFYVFYGWLPSYIVTHWHIQTELTLGMTLVNMTITLGLIPCAAHLADKGLPRLAATAAVLLAAGLLSVPMLLAVSSRSLVAAWLMQLLDLVLNASIFGWLPTIGSVLFPVHVRASGYNFAHTAAQSWLGGLTPLIISGLALRLQQDRALPGALYLVTGLYLTACAAVSLCALAVMWRLFPQTNRDPQRCEDVAGGASAALMLPVAAPPQHTCGVVRPAA